MAISSQIQALLDKGVTLYNPESIEVDAAVNTDLISQDATIHQGCRIRGENTSIGPNCVIGEEAPATVANCQLEENVSLKGGAFSEATFLYGSSMGSESHVRAETLMEENASCAHATGLKHTILMPFVTIGSLVNFCDCMMGGGNSKSNHSEVGSSYIHFNFTPNQDKATPSLIGDVPRGVMLDQPPIFLGGQGGLVGPAYIEFGTIMAAGSICRRDVKESGKLIFGRSGDRPGETSFHHGLYGNIDRIVENNINYIGNLCALKQWYIIVRTKLAAGKHRAACIQAATKRIDSMIDERISRLDQLAKKMPKSIKLLKETGNQTPAFCRSQQNFSEQWSKLETELNDLKDNVPGNSNIDTLLEAIDAEGTGSTYLDTIQNLTVEARNAGIEWLKGITDLSNLIWNK